MAVAFGPKPKIILYLVDITIYRSLKSWTWQEFNIIILQGILHKCPYNENGLKKMRKLQGIALFTCSFAKISKICSISICSNLDLVNIFYFHAKHKLLYIQLKGVDQENFDTSFTLLISKSTNVNSH